MKDDMDDRPNPGPWSYSVNDLGIFSLWSGTKLLGRVRSAAEPDVALMASGAESVEKLSRIKSLVVSALEGSGSERSSLEQIHKILIEGEE